MNVKYFAPQIEVIELEIENAVLSSSGEDTSNGIGTDDFGGGTTVDW